MIHFLTLHEAATLLAGPNAPAADIGQFVGLLAQQDEALMLVKSWPAEPSPLPGGTGPHIAMWPEEWRVPFVRFKKWCVDQGYQLEGAPDAAQTAQQAGPLDAQFSRRQRRYQMCVDAGFALPDNDYARLPRGIGKLAKQEGVTRQAFSEDVKAHINYLRKR